MTTSEENISSDVKMADLSAFLKAKRGRAGDLAKFLGVPAPQLSNWLHGRFAPSAETLAKMSQWYAAATAQEAADNAAAADRLRSAINRLRQ